MTEVPRPLVNAVLNSSGKCLPISNRFQMTLIGSKTVESVAPLLVLVVFRIASVSELGVGVGHIGCLCL